MDLKFIKNIFFIFSSKNLEENKLFPIFYILISVGMNSL